MYASDLKCVWGTGDRDVHACICDGIYIRANDRLSVFQANSCGFILRYQDNCNK